MKRDILTNYSVAVHWLDNQYVLCNEIPNVDSSVWDNMILPPKEEEEDDEPILCPECCSDDVDSVDYGSWLDCHCNNCEHEWEEAVDEEEEEDDYPEIFQFFITNATTSDVKYLSENFGLIFTYSNMLELYILCVDHCGTAWDYVECYTSLPAAERKLGEKK